MDIEGSEIDLCNSLVDPVWELIDPNPDIWQLFAQFDERFFHGTLKSNFVELQWSSARMTSTAGVCSWSPRTNFAVIKLSKPLLTLRSRGDLVETLLHEMIHAYLFVTREDDNHESHGPKFHSHMYRINSIAGTKITVFHTFHDEVRHYQKHVWRCEGPCASRPPYYGYVHRASNRAPGPNDFWWSKHQADCGGSFKKISEPVKQPIQNKSTKPKAINAPPNNRKIDEFFSISPKKPDIYTPSTSKGAGSSSKPSSLTNLKNYFTPLKVQKSDSIVPFSGQGFRLGSAAENSSSSRSKSIFPSRTLVEKVPLNSKSSTSTVFPEKRLASSSSTTTLPPPVIQKMTKTEPVQITLD